MKKDSEKQTLPSSPGQYNPLKGIAPRKQQTQIRAGADPVYYQYSLANKKLDIEREKNYYDAVVQQTRSNNEVKTARWRNLARILKWGAILIVTLIVAGEVILYNIRNEVPGRLWDFRNKPYAEAVERFKDAGFVFVFAREESEKCWRTAIPGTVADITIQGKNTFKKGERFPSNAIVRITYHSSED